MWSFVVVCHYVGILRSDEDDAIYIGGERRVLIVDDEVTLDRFEG